MAETEKAKLRRIRDGFFEKYAKAPGIDVGSGVDPIRIPGFRSYDYYWTTIDSIGGVVQRPSGKDAQTLEEIGNEEFETVYASHILEHLPDPYIALKNWWRVLRPGGHLIVCVPHRDLYEKKKTHPSRWNPRDREGGGGHLTFWLPDKDEEPDTLSFKRVLAEALSDAELLYFKVEDEGYDYSLPENVHPVGEYAIEAVLRKP